MQPTSTDTDTVESSEETVASAPAPGRFGPAFVQLATALASVAIACGALTGWLFDIPPLTTWIPGQATLKVSTALCIIAIGVSLSLQAGVDPPQSRRRVARTIAVLAAVLAGLNLLEYLGQSDPGLNGILATFFDRSSDTPTSHRMASNTALGLLCAALVASCLDARSRAMRNVLLVMTAIPFVLGMLVLISYGLNTRSLQIVAGFQTVSFPTSISMCSGSLLKTHGRHSGARP